MGSDSDDGSGGGGGGGGSSSNQLTAASIGKMTVPELKEELKGLQLKFSGKKAELAERLRDHFGLDEEEEEDEAEEIDEFAEHYPLHTVGSCAATWTHNGEVGALGGQKLKATAAGLMESRGMAKMMAALPGRGAAVGRFCGDDDNKLVAHLRGGGISQELYALMDKDADPNHRLASCPLLLLLAAANSHTHPTARALPARVKNMAAVGFAMATSGFPGKQYGIDVISRTGAKLLKRDRPRTSVQGGSLYLQEQMCAPKYFLAMSSAIVTTCGAKKGVKSSFSGSGSAAIRTTRARVYFTG